MADDKPPMPQQPSTVQLPAVPAWAVELTLDVKTMRAEINDRLDKQDESLDKCVTAGVETNTRLTRVEVRVDNAERAIGEIESRITRTSSRVRDASQTDLAHEAKLAEEISARQALERQHAEEKARREKLEADMVTKADLAKITATQTSAIVDDVKAAIKKPMVQKILWALGGLIIVAINAATTYLTSGAHHP